jgi:predicted AAA+ superfamily ATPase
MDFKRAHILNELISTIDNKLIKILIGTRRIGKSYILEMFQKYLIKLGNFENCFTYDFNDKIILTKYRN